MTTLANNEHEQVLQKVSAYHAMQLGTDALAQFAEGETGNFVFQLNIGTVYNWSFSVMPYDIEAPGAMVSYTEFHITGHFQIEQRFRQIFPQISADFLHH